MAPEVPLNRMGLPLDSFVVGSIASTSTSQLGEKENN